MPRALYLLALAVFAMGTSEFMLAGLVPAVAADLGVPLGAAGLLTTAFAVGMVVGAPAMAVLARRWPPRTALLGFLLGFALTHVISAATADFTVLLGARVVAAVANAGFLAVALSAASALVPEDRKGRALAVLLSGTTLATIGGVPGGALLGNLLGWRATFWAIALLCVPAAVGIVRGVPRVTAAGTAVLRPSSATPPLQTEVRQLARPRLALVMLLAALVNAGTFAAFTFLAPIVTETAGLGDLWVPAVLMIFGTGSFLGVNLAGRLSDRRPAVVLAVGGPLLLVGWVALALLAAHPVALCALALSQGLLAFGVGSTLVARVLHEAAEAPTMAGAYATVALNVGAAGGPALGALALATGAGELGPVWAAVLLVTVALAVVLPLRRVVLPRSNVTRRG